MGPQSYLDFDVTVSRHGDEIAVRVLRSPAGETTTVRSAWPGVAALWRPERPTPSNRRLAPLSGARPGPAPDDPPDDRLVGEVLFRALMVDAVLVRFRASVLRAGAVGSGLRIMLRFEGGADVLPWELLRDPQTDTFVALDPRIPLVRCTETAVHELEQARGAPLRILVAVTSPLATTPIDGATEFAELTARLTPVTSGSAVVVDVIENASLDGIRAALLDRETHVFHYIGHGTVGPDGRSALALTDGEGRLSVRSLDDVAAVLGAAPSLRLVVLNSCHGSIADPGDPFAGAGTSLVRAGIPAVIAMRAAVSDAAAVAFAASLYEGLAAAAPIEQAVTRARAALADSDTRLARDWPIIALHLSSSVAAGLRAGLLPPLDEDVEFTVARPPRLLAERWETLLVLAHHGEPFVAEDGRTVDQVAQVRARVQGLFGAEPVRTTTEESSLVLPRGARLVIVPELPHHVECHPRQADLAWTGDVAEARFFLRANAAAAGTTAEGWLRVFCGPVVIAETRLELPIHRDGQAGETPRPSPIPRYRRIFPCFDRGDAAVVEGVAAVARALGDDYLDRVVTAQQEDAPTGWLLPLIDDADVFQLFWSSRSMVSPACREQWEHALATPRDGFVLPLYWEQPFPRAEGLPPAEMSALQFRRLPSALATDHTPTPRTPSTHTSIPPAMTAPPVRSDPTTRGLPQTRRLHPALLAILALALVVVVVWALVR
ncbi:CHAT domain-containing protein [Humibacillus xanthopallidus]|uniref:CHAT domain-containing protein n=1 Tax=Humibacillus xanthopallidus TaxID=412689 RepID=UPI0038512201